MKNGKFYFPGGRPPVVDGKFVTNAEDCCCGGCVCHQDPSDFTQFSSCSKLHWGYFTAAQWDSSASTPFATIAPAPDDAGNGWLSYNHPFGFKAAAMFPRRPGYITGDAISWKSTVDVMDSLATPLAIAAGLTDGAQKIEIRYLNGVWSRRNSDSDPWVVIGAGDKYGTFVTHNTVPANMHGHAIEFVNVAANNDCDGDPGGECVIQSGDEDPAHIVSTTSRVIVFSATNTYNEINDPHHGWQFNGDTSAQDASSSAFLSDYLSDMLDPLFAPKNWPNLNGTSLFDYYLSGADPNGTSLPTSGSAGPFGITQNFHTLTYGSVGSSPPLPATGSSWFGDFTRGALDAGGTTALQPGGGGEDPDTGLPIDTREITEWCKLVFVWNNNHCWTLT